jgi:hypothetical protein
MKLLIATLASMMLAAAAHAGTIEPPPGWRLDASLSSDLGGRLNETGHFGLDKADRPIRANADVYVPAAGGVVLSVVLVAAKTQDELAAAARAAIDDLHASSQRAALSGSGIVEEGWQEKVDAAQKQIEATLAWRDPNAKTSSTARVIVVADGERITAVTGECFASDDSDGKLVDACKVALATLDPGVDPAQRVALALAPAGSRPTPRPQELREPARMDDGTRVPLPPMTIPQEGRTVDRRPVYVGIALVVLAALFWWNRRYRARRDAARDTFDDTGAPAARKPTRMNDER